MSHDHTTNPCPLPVAHFNHVKDNEPQNQTTTWEQFRAFLALEAKRELVGKEDARLFSPTISSTAGRMTVIG
jgi:hypothetical protein